MVGPPQEGGDPTPVWQVFKSVFKNLNSARAASQETLYLTSLTQIVSEYPQALVATCAWPDLADKGRKRDAVTSALVRRLIHFQAVRDSSTMAATVELLNLVLSVLHRHSLTRWSIVVRGYILKHFSQVALAHNIHGRAVAQAGRGGRPAARGD